MGVSTVDKRDVKRRFAPEAARRRKAAEPPTHDDNSVPTRRFPVLSHPSILRHSRWISSEFTITRSGSSRAVESSDL
jgi:hypothetical protein